MPVSDPVEQLNARCFCVTVDAAALRRALEAEEATHGLYDALKRTHADLFARSPIFLSRDNVAAIEQLVAAVESVVALPQYQEAALSWAPAIAQFEPRARGVLMSYDFHVTPEGPRLIEINTNAGGAFLNAALAKAQQACCAPVREVLAEPGSGATLQDALYGMFRAEWRLERGDAPLDCVAIVDAEPERQYLYPEFLLAAQLLRRNGIEVLIADPREIESSGGGLRLRGRHIDLVYNRLTDFALEDPAHAALRDAYLARTVVVTPHPRAHALYADKRNLTLLGDPRRLGEWGVSPADVTTLTRCIPATRVVDAVHADELWAARKSLFFKPVSGFGGKAAYRGDKVTKRVWQEILAGSYVAQQLVPPSERTVEVEGQATRLKLDVRCYTYSGRMLALAGRLYRGQTTNFRTPGGGFATVFTPAARTPTATNR